MNKEDIKQYFKERKIYLLILSFGILIGLFLKVILIFIVLGIIGWWMYDRYWKKKDS